MPGPFGMNDFGPVPGQVEAYSLEADCLAFSVLVLWAP